MKLRLVDGLPFASLRVEYGRLSVDLPNALLDTGLPEPCCLRTSLRELE